MSDSEQHVETDEATETEANQKSRFSSRSGPSMDPEQVKQIRTTVSRVVWGVIVFFAAVLVGAALAITFDANENNGLIEFLMNFADSVDLGVFDLDNPIREFGGDNADKKTALFNYGIGAIVYLVLGRIAERIIKP